MKKILLLIITCFMSYISVFAQNVFIYRANGDVIQIPVSQTDSMIVKNTYPKLVRDTIMLHDTITVTKNIVQHDTVTITNTIVLHDTIYISNNDTTITPTSEHEYVDLGLPSGTLWATCNIGASKPEEYGDYFAFGEVTPQPENIYNWNSYKWCEGKDSTLTKYCIEDIYGLVDNKTLLDEDDDAATVNWGKDWCIPTQAQTQELSNKKYTKHEWTTVNGTEGMLFTSLSNGNSVFFPASGTISNSWHGLVGKFGEYRTNEITGYNSQYSRILMLFSNSASNYGDSGRYMGISIRPVRVTE